MSDTVVTVENLSKAYLLGRQEKQDTLFGSIATAIKSPLHNFRQLHRLNTFNLSKADEDAEDILWALRDVSFEVKQGEVLGIIGRNGAGKSTLLKILSKIVHPTHGRVEIRGRVSALLEVGTGFHPELSGRENVYLNGTILGMKKKEIDSKFDEIVDFSGVEKFLDTPVKRYSSGMKVRLAFAVAAHLETEILIVDEVLAVGDAEFQKKCLGKMQQVSTGEGRTVLFVSHNMTAVNTQCSVAMFLDNGSVTYEGAVEDVIEKYLHDGLVEQSNGAAGAIERFEQDEQKAAQISRVMVLDASGVATLRHSLVNDIVVQIDFLVNEPQDNLMLCCRLYNRLGEILFVTTEADAHYHSFPSDRMNYSRTRGRYSASLTIKGPLLNEGVFELELMLFSPRRAIYDSVRGIHLHVEDDNSFASYIFQARRRGDIVPVLTWEAKRSDAD